MTGTELNLPNYFLADLPSSNSLSAQVIRDACQSLKHNRAQYLRHRSTRELIHLLSEAGQSLASPQGRFHQLLLSLSPAATGFPQKVLANGLRRFFQDFTATQFEALVVQEFGHIDRLDELTSSDTETRTSRTSRALGPDLLVHVAAGNLPCPAWMSLTRGLLLRSAQFMKCASGSSLLPRILAHCLHELDPKVASCIEIAEWPGGSKTLEDSLFQEASCVTATGSDETLDAIRARLPARVRWAGFGDRISFGFVAREALTPCDLSNTVESAADDIVAWNQRGCLSPHLLYVEHPAPITPEEFSERLASELDRRERTEPRGPIAPEDAAAIATRRSFYHVRSAHLADTRLWQSEDSTAWTVVFETNPQCQLSCRNRFIYIKPVHQLEDALHAVDPWLSRISTVGLAAAGRRARILAEQLAREGIPRICPLGSMQRPPLLWRQDGRPSLADLATWTDWEC